jgi:hypothetical protein
MQRWGNSVELKDLKVGLGKWEPTEVARHPPWTSLVKANVWQHPAFSGRRLILVERRESPERVRGADGEVVGEDFPFDILTEQEQEMAQAGNPPKRRVYVYGAAATVPGQVAACKLRAAVLLTGEPTDSVSHRPCGQLEGAARTVPVMVYGHVGVAGAVAGQLANRYRELKRHTIDVWIWPAEGARYGETRSVRRQLVLLFPVGTVNMSKVFPMPSRLRHRAMFPRSSMCQGSAPRSTSDLQILPAGVGNSE